MIEPFNFAAPGPMTPETYIRLRREAAGLTIAKAALPFYRREEHRADVEAVLRDAETPGVKLKQHVAQTLPRAFPFDPNVYRQLCEDPPERHPSLCRGCACSIQTPCSTQQGFHCRITQDGICTACIEKVQRAEMRRAA
jgi:hypothetical protein